MTPTRRMLLISRHCLCAAIMLAFTALAIRGHGHWEQCWTPTTRPQLQLVNYTDRVEFSLIWYPATVNPAWGRGGYNGHQIDGPASWTVGDRETHWDDQLPINLHCLGIMFRSGLKSTTGSELPLNNARIFSLMFPHWIPVLLAALPLILAARRSRPRPTAGEIPCRTCDYDLRAHQPGNNCPECGTSIAPALFNTARN